MDYYQGVGTDYLRALPRVTTLELLAPWRYFSWNRPGEQEKTTVIPQEMRIPSIGVRERK